MTIVHFHIPFSPRTSCFPSLGLFTASDLHFLGHFIAFVVIHINSKYHVIMFIAGTILTLRSDRWSKYVTLTYTLEPKPSLGINLFFNNGDKSMFDQLCRWYKTVLLLSKCSTFVVLLYRNCREMGIIF